MTKYCGGYGASNRQILVVSRSLPTHIEARPNLKRRLLIGQLLQDSLIPYFINPERTKWPN